MSIACTDPLTGATSNSTVDMANHKVSIVADPSQQVDCTFTSEQISPTAAGVSIAGRVVDSSGRGLRGVTVKLIDMLGNTTDSRNN